MHLPQLGLRLRRLRIVFAVFLFQLRYYLVFVLDFSFVALLEEVELVLHLAFLQHFLLEPLAHLLEHELLVLLFLQELRGVLVLNHLVLLLNLPF